MCTGLPIPNCIHNSIAMQHLKEGMPPRQARYDWTGARVRSGSETLGGGLSFSERPKGLRTWATNAPEIDSATAKFDQKHVFMHCLSPKDNVSKRVMRKPEA